ncbi:MAG: helix-turn-helix domain-containing protein [Anaerolineae bacterium]|nr:helix-turn-helix domain-containing protein [Anaerolineae bacterium]
MRVKRATSTIINTVNTLLAQPDFSPANHKRNKIIRARYAAGESQAQLARDFGISYQRVYQIIYSKPR